MMNVCPWRTQLMAKLPQVQASTDVHAFLQVLWLPCSGTWEGGGRKCAFEDLLPHFSCSPCEARKRGNLYLLSNSKKQWGWKQSILAFPMFTCWSRRSEKCLGNSPSSTVLVALISFVVHLVLACTPFRDSTWLPGVVERVTCQKAHVFCGSSPSGILISPAAPASAWQPLPREGYGVQWQGQK